ncbi:MAG: Asp-tRNA(Asn)/Glu-tRNA(Gln) amidotransferase subunit GatB [Bdellovibrionales bacterium]|nr:Asp-tRNA(Asn)/Glu-tRNA(Gln) amidotransferase subunit GatB [Bdellovibrionales bacterium]
MSANEKAIEAVIGLEVHCQLSTDSKIFATSSTAAGEVPNSLTDPVTLGLPGCLPVLNKKVVEYAIKLGLATHCSIQRESIFARKHYLYPDLPKGYQISQYEKPICLGGNITVRLKEGIKNIGITRIHLEEDAGKSSHVDGEAVSVVDLNRAGVPLVEIVSEPDMRTSEEAGAYMRLLRQTVRYLDISDGNMEEGSLRCDANVSVRYEGSEKFGTKVEVKNINSFRFVEKAIDYEIERQSAMLRNGEEIIQETRLWDEAKGKTRSMRSKEFAEDYRYFPDPDLLPLIVDNDWIDSVKNTLPELPDQVYQRFKSMYGLDDYNADVLTQESLVARYYDQAVSVHGNAGALANWIGTELFGRLNKEGMTIENCPVSPENLADLVHLIGQNVISGKIAKKVFDEMFSSGARPAAIIEQQGLQQITDESAIMAIVQQVLDANPQQLEAYRSGKDKMFGFFVGQIMKLSEGKANPQIVNTLLKQKLDE